MLQGMEKFFIAISRYSGLLFLIFSSVSSTPIEIHDESYKFDNSRGNPSTEILNNDQSLNRNFENQSDVEFGTPWNQEPASTYNSPLKREEPRILLYNSPSPFSEVIPQNLPVTHSPSVTLVENRSPFVPPISHKQIPGKIPPIPKPHLPVIPECRCRCRKPNLTRHIPKHHPKWVHKKQIRKNHIVGPLVPQELDYEYILPPVPVVTPNDDDQLLYNHKHTGHHL